MGIMKTKFDTPVVLRKDIIKKATIESGLISEENNELFNKFWERYLAILSEYKDCVVLD